MFSTYSKIGWNRYEKKDLTCILLWKKVNYTWTGMVDYCDDTIQILTTGHHLLIWKTYSIWGSRVFDKVGDGF